MEKARLIFFRFLGLYLIYVLVFAVIIFAIYNPKEKESIEIFANRDGRMEPSIGDRTTLVGLPEEAIRVRLDLIETAQESIDISYYALLGGESVQVFLSSILEAADRGVEVRILLDGIFNNLNGSLRGSVNAFTAHPNINLKFYEPLNILLPMSWNNRLHDKFIIIDGKLALIGGRNIGDKYFFPDEFKDKYVKDRDALIYNERLTDESASVIDDMQEYYNYVWNHKYSKTPKKSLTSREERRAKEVKDGLRNNHDELIKPYATSNGQVDWYKMTIPVDNIKFVCNPIGRSNQDPWCLKELYNLASQAEETVFAQSPYIIPSRTMKNNLKDYEIDFNKVSVLTNSLASSPNPFAVAGYSNNRKKIVNSNIEVFEYQGPDSIHAKTYIFDDYTSVIGSFNLDARSSHLSTESMVIIESEEFAKELKESIDIDLNKSLKIDKDYSYVANEDIKEGKVPNLKKIFIGILSKITLFIDYLL